MAKIQELVELLKAEKENGLVDVRCFPLNLRDATQEEVATDVLELCKVGAGLVKGNNLSPVIPSKII